MAYAAETDMIYKKRNDTEGTHTMNTKPGVNRRTQVTKRMMHHALIELLEQKPLSNISVKELCELADVNRSTFYAHYSNIAELQNEIESETLEWVGQALNRILQERSTDNIEIIVAQICDYVAKNHQTLHILLANATAGSLQTRIISTVYNHKEIVARISQNNMMREEVDLRIRFAISGALGILRHWMDTNLSAPVSTVAHVIAQMAAIE